jgi:hypothetical protein
VGRGGADRRLRHLGEVHRRGREVRLRTGGAVRSLEGPDAALDRLAALPRRVRLRLREDREGPLPVFDLRPARSRRRASA